MEDFSSFEAPMAAQFSRTNRRVSGSAGAESNGRAKAPSPLMERLISAFTPLFAEAAPEDVNYVVDHNVLEAMARLLKDALQQKPTPPHFCLSTDVAAVGAPEGSAGDADSGPEDAPDDDSDAAPSPDEADAASTPEAQPTRMGDGIVAPFRLKDVFDIVPQGYEPPSSITETLRALPADRYPPEFIERLLADFETDIIETKRWPLADVPALTKDDALAIYSYSYEIKLRDAALQELEGLEAVQDKLKKVLGRCSRDIKSISAAGLGALASSGMSAVRLMTETLPSSLKLNPRDRAALQAFRKWFAEDPERDPSHRHQVYADCNAAIRSAQADPARLQIFLPLISHISNALGKLNPQPQVVYRGINISVSALDYTRGSMCAWPAFSSTSADPKVSPSSVAPARDMLQEPEVARAFSSGGKGAGVLFVIHSHSGRDISRLSRVPAEAELVLKTNTCFVVQPAPSAAVRKFIGVPDRMHVFELRELDAAEQGSELLLARADEIIMTRDLNPTADDEVGALYAEMMEKYPSTAAAQAAWGFSCLPDQPWGRGNMDDATAHILKALQIDGNHVWALTLLATTMEESQPEVARYWHLKCIDLAPNFRIALYNAALFLSGPYRETNNDPEFQRLASQFVERYNALTLEVGGCDLFEIGPEGLQLAGE